MSHGTHAPLCYCMCLCGGENSVNYWILPQKEQCYILSYQYFLPEDKSFLRMLSPQAMTLLRLCDLAFLCMKEKEHCLIETAVPSTSSVSGLWKPGCPWVAFTDTLSASYLHSCMSMNKWSVAADLWCYFCMFLGLCFVLLQKHFPSVLLSLSFYICVCVCVFVQLFLPCCYFSLLIIQAFQTASYWINPSPFIWGW